MLERHCHRVPDRRVECVIPDKICDHPHAFVQDDGYDHVRGIVAELGQRCAAHDGEGLDPAGAFAVDPA